MIADAFSRFSIVGSFCCCCLLMISSSITAQEWDNDSGDQNWDNPVNWEGDVFPEAINLTVNVDAAGEFPIVSSTPSFTPIDIFVGTGLEPMMGMPNTGRIDHNSGTLSTGAGNWMFVGHEGGVGTYNLTGSGSLLADSMNIGAWGGNFAVGTVNIDTTGTMDLIGGAERPFGFGDCSLLVGENLGEGNLNFDGGTINSLFTTRVGHNAIGNFSMTGGELNTTGETWFGSAGGTGTGVLDGGTMNSTSFFVVARGGIGTFTLNDGTVNGATDVNFNPIASFDGAIGELNLNGGTFNSGSVNNAASMLVGEGGMGTLNHNGGMLNVGGNLQIGVTDTGVGAFNANGSAAIIMVGQDLTLGLDLDLLDTLATGTLNFVADASGVSVVVVGGDVNLSSPDGDFLTVDLSQYTGAYEDIILIDGVTSQGEFTDLPQGTTVDTGFAGGDYEIDYSVAGQVWLRTSDGMKCDFPVGDVNMDGNVDLLDVAPFVAALSGGGFICEADINEDGFVDLLDVAPFVALLSGG